MSLRLSKRYTAFGSQIFLHRGTGTPGTSPPDGVNYHPSQIALEGEVGDVFAYTDDEGTTKSITLPASGLYVFAAGPSTIETTTDLTAVTVWWDA